MIQVYHNSNNLVTFYGYGPAIDDLRLVAEVDTNDLETAYEKTCSTPGADLDQLEYWWSKSGVKCLIPFCTARDTHVGDVFVLNGIAYIVEPVGCIVWHEGSRILKPKETN